MKSKFIFVCIALICAMCFFVSCDNNTLSVDEVTVSFDSNGGEQIKSIIVEKGKTISLPIPTKENYIFEGWTLDGKPFTKDSIVSSDITLLANWKWDERVWDGTVDSSWFNSELSEFTITKASQLAGLAELVNNGTTFSSKTVILANDLNLNNKKWTSIGRNADSSNKFQGTLDGNNKTISNLLVEDLSEDYHAAGFFGALNGKAKNLKFENANINSISRGNSGGQTDNGTAVVAGSIYAEGSIENVSVKNAHITGNRYVGGVVGYCYGSVNNCNVENITIDCNPDNLTGNWDNGDKAGGIAGYFVDKNKFSIKNNVVKDTTITAYRDFGGLIGTADTTNNIKENNADNIYLLINNEHNYKNYSSNEGHLVSGTVGRVANSGTIDSSNKETNVHIAILN